MLSLTLTFQLTIFFRSFVLCLVNSSLYTFSFLMVMGKLGFIFLFSE